MLLDIASAAAAVLLALALSLLALRVFSSRPIESRGMIGLAISVALLLLALAFPALLWIIRPPGHPLTFVLSVLFFYWFSLIILVLTIIRWLRHGPSPLARAAGGEPDTLPGK